MATEIASDRDLAVTAIRRGWPVPAEVMAEGVRWARATIQRSLDVPKDVRAERAARRAMELLIKATKVNVEMEANEIRAAAKTSTAVHFHSHGGGAFGPRVSDMSVAELLDYVNARQLLAEEDGGHGGSAPSVVVEGSDADGGLRDGPG